MREESEIGKSSDCYAEAMPNSELNIATTIFGPLPLSEKGSNEITPVKSLG